MIDRRAQAPCPWWVNTLDLATLSLLLIGVGVMIWTVPRVWVGFGFLSIRSPWRVLAWAAGVAALRHLSYRRSALPLRLWGLAAQFLTAAASWGPLSLRHLGARLDVRRSLAFRATVVPFLLSRAAVLLVGYLAVVAIEYPSYRPWPRLASREPMNLMAKWDAEWYLAIASEGYQWDGNLRHEAKLAFFPAYPMASRMAGWIAGSPAAGAALVALTSFFAALIYLFRLAREDLGDAKAEVAVQFLAFAPFAVYYSAIYAESLYLLGVVAAFYYFRRGAWARASVWGLLVGLTRPNGCLLSAVLLTALIERAVRARRAGEPGGPGSSRLIPGILAASMPTVGLGVYCAFVYFLTGDAFGAFRLHALWGRGDTTFWGMVVLHYDWIHKLGFSGYVTAYTTDFINCCAALLALLAVWPVTRRFGAAYGVFIALNLAAPMSSGTMLSLARLTATMFPIFLWLADAVPATRRTPWIAAFAVLQGFAAVMFFTWRWLY